MTLYGKHAFLKLETTPHPCGRYWVHNVLMVLVSQLSVITLKKDITAFLSYHNTLQLIQNLDGNELKEWQNGLKTGVEKGDWTELAAHYMY